MVYPKNNLSCLFVFVRSFCRGWLLYHVLHLSVKRVCQCASVPVYYQCACCMHLCQYASMPVCQYTSMSVCQYASILVCQYASMPVCQYTSMPLQIVVPKKYIHLLCAAICTGIIICIIPLLKTLQIQQYAT